MTPSRAERLRHNIVLFGLAALFIALGGRIYYLQVLCHQKHLAAVDAQTRMEVPLPARRGEIVDCRGRPLALSVPAYLVAANLRDIADREATARKLAPLLNLSVEEIQDKLERDRKFVFLKRKVPLAVGREIERLQQAERKAGGPRALAGIALLPDSRRSYVCGKSACHLLGHLDIDDRGQGGAEQALNSVLQGTPGKWQLRRDGRSLGIGIVDETFEEPVPGNRAVLTVDLEIQQALEDQLEVLAEQYTPVGAFGLVVEANTGRVLAMASWPNFDPNRPGDCEAKDRLNRVICTVLEPGSTFKPFPAAAALETGAAKPADRIFCENGAYRTGSRVITDAHGYGWLSFLDVVVKSSNIGMAKVGEKLGAGPLSEYCQAFGFGRLTGMGLPGECEGLLRPARLWRRDSVQSIAFGHEITVTPLQLAVGYAALANGGRLYQPQFVLRFEDAKGRTSQEFPPQPVAQAISAKTSATVREMLRQVVERGTGKLAQIEEFNVAGKTGTARKLVGGHYSTDRHFSSFVGLAPADRPRVVALITVDEPQGAQYGGTVAAPAVGALLRETLLCLGYQPRPKSAVAESPVGR